MERAMENDVLFQVSWDLKDGIRLIVGVLRPNTIAQVWETKRLQEQLVS